MIKQQKKRFYQNQLDINKRAPQMNPQQLNIIKTMQASTLQGITIQNYQVVPFNREMLKTIDLQVFTPTKVHYLVNALIHNTKLPSEQAMIRSIKKNLEKSGADKADKVVGRLPRFPAKRRKLTQFRLPNKYGNLKRTRRNRQFNRGSLRQPRGNSMPVMLPTHLNGLPIVAPMLSSHQQPINSGLPANLPLMQPVPFQQNQQSVVYQPPNNQNSLNQTLLFNQQLLPGFCLNQLVEPNNIVSSPTKIQQQVKKREEVIKKIPEIAKKTKAKPVAKSKSNAFKTHDPEWIVLKAYKAEACQLVQKYREEIKKDKQPIISENLKDPLPLYFQKKKANQKRRRQQKHQLIKKNKKALFQIFGSAIFQRGWPISRKQIKIALGIQQEGSMIEENIAQFMGMVEENQIEPISVEKQSNEGQIPKEGQL